MVDPYHATLGNLNTEIDRLKKERDGLINAKNFKDAQAIQTLEWCRDFKAAVQVNPLSGAGLPKYTVYIYGKNAPQGRSIVIAEGKNYWENTVYSSFVWADNFAAGEFTTSDKEALYDLLRRGKFKEVTYDTELLEVLSTVKEISDVRRKQ